MPSLRLPGRYPKEALRLSAAEAVTKLFKQLYFYYLQINSLNYQQLAKAIQIKDSKAKRSWLKDSKANCSLLMDSKANCSLLRDSKANCSLLKDSTLATTLVNLFVDSFNFRDLGPHWDLKMLMVGYL